MLAKMRVKGEREREKEVSKKLAKTFAFLAKSRAMPSKTQGLRAMTFTVKGNWWSRERLKQWIDPISFD